MQMTRMSLEVKVSAASIFGMLGASDMRMATVRSQSKDQPSHAACCCLSIHQADQFMLFDAICTYLCISCYSWSIFRPFSNLLIVFCMASS